MLGNLLQRKNERLDEQIDKIHERMLVTGPETEGYEKLLDAFERLTKLENETKSSGVDPNTVLVVSSNILAILIIVGYERGHVIASKALQFLVRTS